MKRQNYPNYSQELQFLEWYDLLSVKYNYEINQDSYSDWRKIGSISHTFKACIRHSLFRLFGLIAENQLLEKLIVSVNLSSSIQFINKISRSISNWIVRVCANPNTVCLNKISIWENLAIVCPSQITTKSFTQ